MEKIQLNSTIIGLGLFSTYHGYGDPQWTLHEDIISEDFEEGFSDISPNYYFQYFNNKKYMEVWNERVYNYIENTLLQKVFNVLDTKFNTISLGHWSPKEYNFNVDSCDFELELDWDSFVENVIKYIDKNKEEFDKYLHDNYTSYDGFNSFTSNNFDSWLNDFNNKRIQEIAAVISFIIDKEYTKQQIEEDASISVFDDLFYFDFVDYTELDKFLKDMSNPTEDWQLDIINRNEKK